MAPRRMLLSALLACCLAGAGHAQGTPHGTPPGASPPRAPRAEPVAGARLPPDATTRHLLDLPGRSLHFTATAGSIVLTDAQGTKQAELAVLSDRLDGVDPQSRPVTFVLNGGPGSASAWLDLGLLGPWRLPMQGEAASPSAPPLLQANADTWLDFTDLVFIDPVDSGYSRRISTQDALRRHLWSVDGDIDSLADTIRIWLVRNHRLASPKFIVGESYSGFRGPKLVRALSGEQGIGITGMVLISPVLDFGGQSDAFDPLRAVWTLPSMVAAARAAKTRVTRATLADVEAYAAGDYLLDLMRGSDPAAIARRSARVAALTGLDPALVARRQGRIGVREFVRELDHADEKVGSPYDATATTADPYPASPFSFAPDRVLDALNAPVTSAMLDLYARLDWQPEGSYTLLNRTVARQWDYGRGTRPESLSDLRLDLALDPHLHVLVAHGLFDLVAPYFHTKLLLDQIAPGAGADRVHLLTYPGGHMFYADDASRAGLREAARQLYAIEWR